MSISPTLLMLLRECAEQGREINERTLEQKNILETGTKIKKVRYHTSGVKVDCFDLPVCALERYRFFFQ